MLQKIRSFFSKSESERTKFRSVSAKMMLAQAMAMCPQSSLESMECMVPLIIAALAKELDLPFVTPNALASICPTNGCYRRYLRDGATDSLFRLRRDILSPKLKVFLTCDKGATRKGQLGHFVKILSYVLPNTNTVKKFILDVDESGGTSKDCAHSISLSVAKLQLGPDFTLYGSATDSGGGGVGVSLASELRKVGLACEEKKYIITYCCLHALQLTLCNPVKILIGEGGLLSDGSYVRNAMQLMHALRDIQDCFGSKYWEQLMRLNKMQVPIFTR